MISIRNLQRKFGHFVAVDDLSLEVQPGEVLGFLGPNGAGKSTTMKMITGFLAPTQGEIEICGHNIATQAQAAQSKIGYLPEGAPSYGDMTVYDFLMFIAEVRGFNKAERKARVAEVIEKVSLKTVVSQQIETLSKGYKRRVGLAQAIIHDPQVLILDEPTDGLDPNQKAQVRNLIQNLSKEKIVIVSTHILEEVTAVCTRAVIIARGKLLFDDKPEKLLAQSKYHNAVSLTLEEGTDTTSFESIDGLAAIEQNGSTITLLPESGEFLYPKVSKLLTEQNIEPINLSVESGRLDEVFRTITLPTEQAAEAAQ